MSSGFDPGRVAQLEAAGWRAYYAKQWPRMLALMVSLSAEEFHMPLLSAIRAAYYSTRGALAFKPVVHDGAVVLRCYERFYELAAKHSGLSFDPSRAARFEMRYWDVHRALERVQDGSELVDALADLHAELFGIDAAAARASAEWRTRAAATVDGITGGRSRDVEGDWRKLEDELRRCYEIVSEARRRA